MPRFAANLHYLFTEMPFLDRFQAAARAGFKGVEAQVPYDWPAEEIAMRLQRYGLEMVLIDTPQGDWDAGERGLAALPGREAEFRAGIARTIAYAQALACRSVHVIAGIEPTGHDPSKVERVYHDNLRFAARQLGNAGVMAMIEPINPHMGVLQGYTTLGMKGFYLRSVAQALRAIEAVGENLHLHLDIYHLQLTEGRISDTLREVMPRVRHIQVAGVPGRHEPAACEINYPYVFNLIDEMGFGGWVGCEYRPASGTLAGLGWARPFGIGG